MDQASLTQLALKYQPIIYLHSDEPHFPIDFEDYLAEAKIKNKVNGVTFKSHIKLDATIFGEWLMNFPFLNDTGHTLYLPRGMQSAIIDQNNPTDLELQQVPLYVHPLARKQGQRTDLLLRYSHLYAYNDSQPLCSCSQWQVGQHFADLEHVTANVSVSKRGDVDLTAFYNSRHNGGVWLAPDELEFEDSRPVVYSSLYSHASYNRVGKFKRYWSVVKDRCDRGKRWDSEKLVTLPNSLSEAPVNLRWALFRGDWGDGRVSGFPSKDWWTQPDVAKNYGQGAWPWKWTC